MKKICLMLIVHWRVGYFPSTYVHVHCTRQALLSMEARTRGDLDSVEDFVLGSTRSSEHSSFSNSCRYFRTPCGSGIYSKDPTMCK